MNFYRVVERLVLLPIYYKCLDCVRDAAEAFEVYILVVSEHFGAGMTDKRQLILVRCLDVFHQGGEGVAAAVGRVLSSVDSVYLYNGIRDSAGFQSLIEPFPVGFNGHPGSI